MPDWFTIEKIDHDTFAISEYKHWEETHCYLLSGTKCALLIDAGLGISDIRKVNVSKAGFHVVDENEEEYIMAADLCRS